MPNALDVAVLPPQLDTPRGSCSPLILPGLQLLVEVVISPPIQGIPKHVQGKLHLPVPCPEIPEQRSRPLSVGNLLASDMGVQAGVPHCLPEAPHAVQGLYVQLMLHDFPLQINLVFVWLWCPNPRLRRSPHRTLLFAAPAAAEEPGLKRVVLARRGALVYLEDRLLLSPSQWPPLQQVAPPFQANLPELLILAPESTPKIEAGRALDLILSHALARHSSARIDKRWQRRT
mmetsp:Transcript_65911/g.155237  ORF Transcript_65911/g.155237 Transcript_65911/m.155237 type:complete len:231 (+) Transcript_65911:663-1355(+)